MTNYLTQEEERQQSYRQAAENRLIELDPEIKELRAELAEALRELAITKQKVLDRGLI